MPAVTRALAQLEDLDMPLWTEESGPSVGVDAFGRVLVSSEPHREAGTRQRVLDEELEVLAPFHSRDGLLGPCRRATTASSNRARQARRLAARLAHAFGVTGARRARRKRSEDLRLYPDVARSALDEALDLEDQLEHNLRSIAA
jgi:hypothetical protein